MALANAVLAGDRDAANAAIRRIKEDAREREELARRNAAAKLTKP
jgi:hypothetical protein